jgi:hypothetical protein
MKLNFFIIILFIFFTPLAFCGEFQFNAAATSVTYDDVPEAKSSGLTLRSQYNFNSGASGFIINYYGSAITALAGELSSGYLWKSSGSVFFEGGLGLSYSAVRGPGPLVIAGIGYKVSQSVYIDLPVILTYAIAIVPYIGITF